MTAPATPPRGLSAAQAAERLARHGPNVLPQPDRRGTFALVIEVLREPMILLLIGAAALYVLLGDPQEAVALALSVVLVVAITAYQELRSERALQALRDLSSPRARVLRDGEVRVVPGREVVVGDVMLVSEGDRVPADARVLEESGLTVDESLLTGESVPVRRTVAAGAASGDAVLHASTLVVAGHGVAEVIAIGADTEVGRIGSTLRTLRPQPTPMQREMRRVVRVFAALSIAVSVLVVALVMLRYRDWLQALLAGITLAIANIPEEFPVVLTVFLALGAWRMARHRALVRRPPAIEALGAVTVLCTDKTGTLTENRMRVAELYAEGLRAPPREGLAPALRALVECAERACPDAPHDPMERAIRDAARAAGVPDRADWVRVHEYPLSPELLATTHVWRAPGAARLQVACKGAPEAVAELCGLPDEERARLSGEAEAMARRGLRVLGACSAEWVDDARTLPLGARGFRFAWRGLIALADPLREGVPAAVAEAQAAGVRVVMMTGDHLETARAIAAQAGLARAGEARTGADVARLDDAALARCAAGIDVFARMKPEQKLRLVRALKAQGAVVAMTGDGVNDAPALVAADVGVAMGGRGTDVAREAAAIVLLDDDFVTVVHAIRQGRAIYDNIVRAVRYILAVHVPITGLALLPLLLGQPLVLLPLHVVILELIIDPASTLVFEREPPAADVMRRPPRPPGARLLDARTLASGLGAGALVFLAVAAVYGAALWNALPAPQAGALAFIALVAGNLGLIVFNRQHAHSFVAAVVRANPAFRTIAAAALALLATLASWDTAARAFGFAPPPPAYALGALAAPWALLAIADAVRMRRRGAA